MINWTITKYTRHTKRMREGQQFQQHDRKTSLDAGKCPMSWQKGILNGIHADTCEFFQGL
jgi:hypothetical protein